MIENTQRDLNIAFMNELSALFERLGIDTGDVLAAAATKWNFQKFTPDLVGGHCIGVDPYYLTYRAEKAGYEPQVILAGRKINDSVGQRIARDGELALNTHGGQLSAGRLHGYGFLHEACVQLWGEAGERQVPGDPEVGVAAAGGGPLAGCLLLTNRR